MIIVHLGCSRKIGTYHHGNLGWHSSGLSTAAAQRQLGLSSPCISVQRIQFRSQRSRLCGEFALSHNHFNYRRHAPVIIDQFIDFALFSNKLYYSVLHASTDALPSARERQRKLRFVKISVNTKQNIPGPDMYLNLKFE